MSPTLLSLRKVRDAHQSTNRTHSFVAPAMSRTHPPGGLSDTDTTTERTSTASSV